MKKTVLRIFSIIFFFVIACTILSAKIEKEMLTQVKLIKPSYGGGEFRLPMTASFKDENGMDRVFSLEEKTGWEAGLRVKELAPNDFTIDMKGISPNSWGVDYYILTASRVPQEGTLVEQFKNVPAEPDTLLLYYPTAIPQKIPGGIGVTMLSYTANSMVMESERTPQPFMEHNEKGRLQTMETPGWRIYSLAHANQFFDNLPLVALVAAFLLLPVGLWIMSCFLAKDEVSNSPLLWANIGGGLACLAGMWITLAKIDLPASLLPATNILEIGHYKTELGQLLEVMKNNTSISQVSTALVHADSAFSTARIILIATAAVILVIAAAEWFIAKKIKLQ